jgi:hypothetical protein
MSDKPPPSQPKPAPQRPVPDKLKKIRESDRKP